MSAHYWLLALVGGDEFGPSFSVAYKAKVLTNGDSSVEELIWVLNA